MIILYSSSHPINTKSTQSLAGLPLSNYSMYFSLFPLLKLFIHHFVSSILFQQLPNKFCWPKSISLKCILHTAARVPLNKHKSINYFPCINHTVDIHFTSFKFLQFSSVQFSRSVVSDSLWPPESQHARPPCSSPSPGVHSDSCPSSPWCHPAILSSVVPFSSCLQSLPPSESFPMSQLFLKEVNKCGCDG